MGDTDVTTVEQADQASSTGDKQGEQDQLRYTETQLRRAISDALATRGGKVGRERDQARADSEKSAADLKAATAKVTQLEGKIAEMEADFEVLSQDDPEGAGKLAKRLNDLDAMLKTAAERVEALDAERLEHAALVDFGLGVAFEMAVVDVADEFEGDPEILMRIAEQGGIKPGRDEDALKAKLREVAKSMGWKRASGPAIRADSGVANGGGPDLRNLSPKEKIKHGLRNWRGK